jgi:hypothetical protein
VAASIATFHDCDQGSFSSELLVDPVGRSASILVVNTTDTGTPAPVTTLHPRSNTEPDPTTDPYLAQRNEHIENLFPTYSDSKSASKNQ